jgi:hypothetical protein
VVWPLLLLSLLFPVARRCAVAMGQPRPDRVQAAVRIAIQTIVVLNAAICLAVRSPVWWAIVILSLLIPMSWSARRIDST